MKFNAAIKRLRNPRSTCLIFKNGKLVLTGCKSVEECNIALFKIAKMIQKLGYKINLTDKNVKNMVGCYNFGFTIDLTSLAKCIGIKASFEPGIFPGLIYTTEKNQCKIRDNCKVIVFRSGKINITGARYEDEINNASDSLFS
jgi:transcription initiation factor TFIID TATA-box-binding protein